MQEINETLAEKYTFLNIPRHRRDSLGIPRVSLGIPKDSSFFSICLLRKKRATDRSHAGKLIFFVGLPVASHEQGVAVLEEVTHVSQITKKGHILA